MLEHYSQPEELLADDSFLNWYFKTGEGEAGAWEEWMAAGAENRALALRAVELLELTRLPEREIPAEQIRQASENFGGQVQRGLKGLVVTDDANLDFPRSVPDRCDAVEWFAVRALDFAQDVVLHDSVSWGITGD